MRTRHQLGINGLDSTVPFFPFVLGFHETHHAPGGAKGRQGMQALVCISLPMKWWWGRGEAEKEGGSGRLVLGKARFGNKMALGNDSRVPISFPGY